MLRHSFVIAYLGISSFCVSPHWIFAQSTQTFFSSQNLPTFALRHFVSPGTRRRLRTPHRAKPPKFCQVGTLRLVKTPSQPRKHCGTPLRVVIFPVPQTLNFLACSREQDTRLGEACYNRFKLSINTRHTKRQAYSIQSAARNHARLLATPLKKVARG